MAKKQWTGPVRVRDANFKAIASIGCSEASEKRERVIEQMIRCQTTRPARAPSVEAMKAMSGAAELPPLGAERGHLHRQNGAGSPEILPRPSSSI